MASPVSFGDAFLMAKLCWTLAQTFTKGRKSAPAEFREVGNQLNSLSTALKSLCDAQKDNGNGAGTLPGADADVQHAIDNVISNCGETLKHLEEVVVKYGVISPDATTTNRKLPFFKQWGDGLARNWKKIAWTTEKGDLAALRGQIAVHTDCMNMLLLVANSSRTQRVEESLERNHVLIKDIHDWYRENLKDGRPIRVQSIPVAGAGSSPAAAARTATSSSTMAAAPSTPTPPPSSALPLPPQHFELHLETEQGLALICRRAIWLGPHSSAASSDAVDDGLGFSFEPGTAPFSCRCDASHESIPLTALQLSPLTFPVRLAGSEVSWMLYKVANVSQNRLCSVHIRSVPSTYLAEFEDLFISGLALQRAEQIFHSGAGNMMAYIESDGELGEEVEAGYRVLFMTSDLKSIQDLIDSVTFSVGKRSFSQDAVASVSMLLYSSLYVPPDEDDDDDDSSVTLVPEADARDLHPMAYAELLVSFEQEQDEDEDGISGGDVSETIMLLRHSTKLSMKQSSATVTLTGIECKEKTDQESSSKVDVMDVTFQLTTLEAATAFHKRLEEMRMELFVLSLQGPRETEDTLLQLQVTQVQCEDIYMADADVLVLQDRKTGKRRMVIASRNRCTVMSQILAQDFLTSQASGKLNFSFPTWLVQLEDRGRRRVFKYEHGLGSLTFRNMQSDRAFELALNAVSGSSSIGLPHRPAPQQLAGT